jgi:hypothetical protein
MIRLLNGPWTLDFRWNLDLDRWKVDRHDNWVLLISATRASIRIYVGRSPTTKDDLKNEENQ